VGALRRLVLPILAAIALLAAAAPGALAGTSPAHPDRNLSAARFAAAATPFQNKVIDRLMARVPGGTRASAGEVEWADGHVRLGVPRSPHGRAAFPGAAKTFDASSGCPDDYFCAYGAQEFGGCAIAFPGGWQVEFDWAAFSGQNCTGDPGTWSWDNETSYRVWKEQDWSGESAVPGAPYYYSGGTDSGNNWCIKPHVSNGDVGDKASRTDGWIQMTANTATC
jgi:hypothetical protein